MSHEHPAEMPAAEVEPHEGEHMDDQAMDDEINNMIVDEFQQAMDQKDKKGILESLRALILSCDKD